MRFRAIGIAALLATGLSVETGAVVAPKGAEAPIVANQRAPRSHRTIGWTRASTTSYLNQRLAADGLTGWTAQWDRDTDVPLRMWSSGTVFSGSIANATVAEAAARQFLAAHIATLAPGATIADFELVSNELGGSGTTRSVGFTQKSGGVRVLGGSIGFAFKADRLVMVSSTALPDVAVATPAQRLSVAATHEAAVTWLGKAGQIVATRASAAATQPDRVIVPIVRPRVGSSPSVKYQLAEQVDVESMTGPGRWTVWVDAADATPIARKTGISYASGRVMFNVSDRSPSGTRSAQPAPNTQFTVNGANVTSAADGTITWAGTAAASVGLNLTGTFATIVNKAGARLTETISLTANQTFTWTKDTEEVNDAQISAFIYANQAKTFAKTKVNPNLAWLDQQIQVNVNENQTCNAFSTGDDIHFFKKGNGCENTGRMADVVYHEFGHSLHANSIIDGIGAFDGSLSEGLADTTSQAITGDSGMGRGFFGTNEPLRELNPVTKKRWPDDADGEVHDEGEIIGEALWDLRVAMQTKLGQQAGYDHWLEMYYSVMQRASDIPSSYPEVLLADDDDGNLDNGTPNTCEINAAFATHGLYDPTLTLGIKPPSYDNYHVAITAMAPPQSACPPPSVSSGTLEWKVRGGTLATIPMTAGTDIYEGDLPTQLDGTVLQYRVHLALSDGSSITFPNNPADPFYETYIGPVTPIKCFDFEDGNVADWAKTADWEVGAPLGLATDPKTAFGGTNVFGIDLSTDGLYSDSKTSSAETAEIDVHGATNVRLQYRRWLGVEDGFFDNARILANNAEVWSNFASPSDPQSAGTNHLDKEWRFQDVDLTAAAAANGGKVKLRFELKSDQGLTFGGWTVDDVCIMAASGTGLTCGNGVVDTGEVCDDGNRTDGDGCDNACQLEGDAGGCCSSSRGAEGATLLSLATFGLVIRRRRRRAGQSPVGAAVDRQRS